MSVEHDPGQLRLLLEAAMPDGVELRARPMFGGIMAYANGLPFASLSNVGLALKLTAAEGRELCAVPGAKPLQYEPDQPPSKSYVVVPDGFFDDPGLLRAWIARSVAGLKSAPKKKPRRAG